MVASAPTNGQLGNGVLNDDGGADVLVGMAGTDTMNGGLGADLLIGNTLITYTPDVVI